MSTYGDDRLYSRLVENLAGLRKRLRLFHHRLCGLRCGRNVVMYGPVTITWPQNVHIGDGCTLNAGVHLGGRGGIVIGHRCRISANAFLETGYLDISSEKRPHAHRPIRLGEDVWVGAGATILAGVEIGDGAVVAAGAVVTKAVPARHVAKGIPATCTPLS